MVRSLFSAFIASAAAVNIVELAESVPDLSTLVAAVVAGGLVDTLSSEGPFTVFAPTNDAFGALPADTLDSLMKPENKAQLVDILTYHVVPQKATTHDLGFFQRLTTVEGKPLHVLNLGDQVLVGASIHSLRTVTGADNLADNGVAHIIDGVLLPETASLSAADELPNIVELAESVDALSTLVSAVVAGGLVDTLSSAGPFTVFAPTNDAFGALPAATLDSLMKPENKAQLVDILTYHVVPQKATSHDLSFFQRLTTVEGKPLHVLNLGNQVLVGASIQSLRTVIGADNLASNGVAHIIDGVLLPETSELAAVNKLPNIVELAESVGMLSTLVAAVVAGDLVDTLTSEGPFTVFAPTNEAFGALPAGTLDSLMKPENKAQLVDILTYHVVPGKALAKDLDLFQALTTVEGKPLHVTKWGGQVRVGASLASTDLKTVTGADNLASNGVAHIIDGVLLPPTSAQPNIVELAESVDALSTLVTAIVAGDLVDTLSAAGPYTVFAPTNDAFGALPAGTLDSLLKPENKDQLVDILTFHVLPQKVLAADLDAFQAVTTVEGKPLHVQKWGGVVRVGASLASADLKMVIGADNIASNGVAHLIDGVLLPPTSILV
jgi:transforming growth factor-beta-induced protein